MTTSISSSMHGGDDDDDQFDQLGRLKTELQVAKSDLIQLLNQHVSGQPKHDELLSYAHKLDQLASRGRDLYQSARQLIPQLNSSSSAGEGHRQSDQLTLELDQAIDMYSTLTYLINLESALTQLELSIDKLEQCCCNNTNQSGQRRDQQLINGLEKDTDSPPPFTLDEAIYVSRVDTVVDALQEVEQLFAKPNLLFDKESTIIFQAFQRSLVKCKTRLSRHVDQLWNRLLLLLTTTPRSSNELDPINWLLSACSLSSSSADDHRDDAAKLSTGVLAQLTICRNQAIVNGVWKLADALNEAGRRASDFMDQFWDKLLQPWLDSSHGNWTSNKTPDRDRDHQVCWAKFESSFIESDENLHLLLPAWRLELCLDSSSTTTTDCDDPTSFIVSSCSQLTSLLTNLSIHLPFLSTDTLVNRLVTSFIQGRLGWATLELTSTASNDDSNFLLDVSLAVRSLAHTVVTSSSQEASQALVKWVDQLPRLDLDRSVGLFLASCRQLITNVDSTTYRQSANRVTVGRDDDLVDPSRDGDLSVEEDVDQDAIGVEFIEDYATSDQNQTTLDRLLGSSHSAIGKTNRDDLRRYLNLKQFRFPKCQISSTVASLLKLLNSVVDKSKLFIDQFASRRQALDNDQADNQSVDDARDSSSTETGSITETALAQTLLETVPRAILIYSPLLSSRLQLDYNKKEADNLDLAVIFHNDLQFLAHECLTLGQTSLAPLVDQLTQLSCSHQGQEDVWRDLEKSAALSTSMLVPHLRAEADAKLTSHIEACRAALRNLIGRSVDHFDGLNLQRTHQQYSSGVQEACSLLHSYAESLRPLPDTLYYKSVGTLSNDLCSHLVTHLLAVPDLATDVCESVNGVFRQVVSSIEYLFSPVDDLKQISKEKFVNHRVPDLKRLHGLLLFLSAPSLAQVRRVLWDKGKGPLAVKHQLQSSELRLLINRSPSSLSASTIDRLLQLRRKFADRTELIRAKSLSLNRSPRGDLLTASQQQQRDDDVSESSSDESDEVDTDGQQHQADWDGRLGDALTDKPVKRRTTIVVRVPRFDKIARVYCCSSSASYYTRRHFVQLAPIRPLFKVIEVDDDDQGQQINDGSTNEQDGDETGSFYLAWLVCMASAVAYNLITIPMRESFNTTFDGSYWRYWLVGNSLADAVYLANLILVKPRTQFDQGGITVVEFRKCMVNYLKSRQFKVDLASLAPLDFVSFAYGREMARFRVLRLLKVATIEETFSQLDMRLNAGYAVRLVRTVTYMLLLIHLQACGYYAFNRWQGLNATSWSIPTGRIKPYIYSFYICMKTATSIGSLPAATNRWEFVFMTCSWLSGIFISAILIGQIIDILDSANSNQINYRKIMDGTLESMRQLRTPSNVIDRVRTWFVYNWEQQKTLNENLLLDSLPVKLQSDLMISVHYQTLSKVSLFQNCERALIYDMILKLKPVVFLPGDYICRKGEVGKEMYIVKNGLVDVVGGPDNSIVFVTLKEGSVFGEISLLALSGQNRRTADVRSRGFATLFSLSKNDFEEIMKNYPQAHELVKRRARRMLKRDKKKAKAASGKAEPEKKKKKQDTSKTKNKTEKSPVVVVEVIPEPPPPTPKMIKAVVEAVGKSYPANQTVNELGRKLDHRDAGSFYHRSRLLSYPTPRVIPPARRRLDTISGPSHQQYQQQKTLGVDQKPSVELSTEDPTQVGDVEDKLSSPALEYVASEESGGGEESESSSLLLPPNESQIRIEDLELPPNVLSRYRRRCAGAIKRLRSHVG